MLGVVPGEEEEGGTGTTSCSQPGAERRVPAGFCSDGAAASSSIPLMLPAIRCCFC